MALVLSGFPIKSSNAQEIIRGWDICKEELNDEENDRIVLICGAGVSIAAVDDSGSWQSLLSSAVTHIHESDASSADKQKAANAFAKIQAPLTTAKDYVDAGHVIVEALKGNKLFPNWLRSEIEDKFRFKGGKVTPLHQTISELVKNAENLGTKSIGLATTNYDLLLERALGWQGARGNINGFSWLENNKIRQWCKGKLNHVLHLHGITLDPDSIILGGQDYDRLNGSSFIDMFRSHLTLDSIVFFIGCGATLRDPAFLEFFEKYNSAQEHRAIPKWFQLVCEDELVSSSPLNKLIYGKSYNDLPDFLEKQLAGWLGIDLTLTPKIIELHSSINSHVFNTTDPDVQELRIEIAKHIGYGFCWELGDFHYKDDLTIALANVFEGSYPSARVFMEQLYDEIYNLLVIVVDNNCKNKRPCESNRADTIKIRFIHALSALIVFRSKKNEMRIKFHNSLKKGEAVQLETMTPNLVLSVLFRDNLGKALIDKAAGTDGPVDFDDCQTLLWEGDVEVPIEESGRSGERTEINKSLLLALYDKFHAALHPHVISIERGRATPDVTALINLVQPILRSVKQRTQNDPILAIPAMTKTSNVVLKSLVQEYNLGVVALDFKDCLFLVSEGAINHWFGLFFEKFREL